MPPSTWNAAKAKVQLRISCQRLRTLQQKLEAQAKATRREIATLVERGKLETARIKVENIINQDIHLELLELLELYCELLLARFSVLDQIGVREPDPAVREGVNSVILAAPRTELKELHILRDLLMHKYGRDYSVAVMENRDNCVPDRIVKKLAVDTPSPELVDAYLTEITKAYGVNYTSAVSALGDAAPSQDTVEENIDDGGVKIPTKEISGEESKDAAKEKSNTSAAKPTTGSSSPNPPPPTNDFDELAARFAALKKK